MSQTTFDDDDLFGEAAEEVRADIEASLAEARAALPDPDEVWAADADNVLGVLNGLRSALDPGDAEEHLRDAKKWYTMAERAHAFADADELQAEIEAVEEVIAEMRAAREGVGDLAATVPELRSALEEAREDADGAGDPETDADADADADADEETDADAEGEEAADADADEETAEADEAAADGGEGEEAEQATLEGDDD